MQMVFFILLGIYGTYILYTKLRLLVSGILFTESEYGIMKIRLLLSKHKTYTLSYYDMRMKIIRGALVSIFFHAVIISILVYIILHFC
jgi:hypothetical protein